jgi:hypothetical protein
MMTSVGCSTFILAAIVIAGVALQRSFAAVEGYARTEGDQLRVLDYVSMDCRRAISASVSGSVLTLTLPPYYSINGASTTPNTPTNSSGTLTYGAGSVTVTYQQSGSNFNRTVVYKDGGGNTITATTAIATNVSAFTVTDQDLTSTVACSIMFFPTFLRSPGGGTWRSGTSAPDGSTPGANGDWFVLTPLQDGSNASSVGNVYFMSGGTYGLLQNVKATQVYCNTFLRNATARQ